MLPTIVTSSPSRIQTVPSPITTIQWNFDQGRRSRRDGIRVSIVPSSAAESLPPSVMLNQPLPGSRLLHASRAVAPLPAGYAERDGVRLPADLEYRPKETPD